MTISERAAQIAVAELILPQTVIPMRTEHQVVWNYTLPAGGIANASLVKNSSSNYDVKWGSIITTSEIDDMMGISNN